MDTGYLPRAAGEAGTQEAAKRHALLEVARTQGVRAMAQTWVQGMVHPDRLQDAALMEAVVAMFARKSADVFAAQIEALLARPDASDVLRALTVPTLLQCGAQDSWSPPAQHADMQLLAPHAMLDPGAMAGAVGMSTLETLAAEAACRALVLRGADAVDGGDAQGFAASFAPDGTLVRPDGSVLQGRAAIAQAYAARDPDRLT
eukprot:gene10959-13402_t